jgi:hypothetical protein
VELDIHFPIRLHGGTETSLPSNSFTLSSAFLSILLSRSLTDSTDFVIYTCEPPAEQPLTVRYYLAYLARQLHFAVAGNTMRKYFKMTKKRPVRLTWLVGHSNR